MFDLPAAKRVRREDLYSPAPSASSSSDTDLEDAVRARLNKSLDFEAVDVAGQGAQNVEDDGMHESRRKRKISGLQKQEQGEEDEEELYAFKLFSAAPTSAANSITPVEPSTAANFTPSKRPLASALTQQVQYIRLTSPSRISTSGSSPHAPRPLAYYLAAPSTPEKHAEYLSSALSGASVLALSQKLWPGMTMSWRITHLPSTSDHSSPFLPTSPNLYAGSTSSATELTHKRTRLGKKSRLLLRKNHEKKEEKENGRRAREKEKKEAEEAREAHLRDKKRRLNREKQVKKRERARLARLEGGQEGAG